MADGPWDLPPEPPTPRAPRLRPIVHRGLIVWLGLLGAAAVLLVGLMAFFPGQASKFDLTQAWMMIGWLALASSGLVYSRRYRAGQVLRNLALWAGVLGVIVIVYTFRNDIAGAAGRVVAEVAPGYAIPTASHEIAVQAASDGHFYVMGQVNGAPVRFVVDTGASEVVLNREDAARAGVDVGALKFNAAGETANGVGFNAPYAIPQLEVGPIHMTAVVGSVNGAPLSTSLLGMTFLSRLQSFEFKGDTLVMRWRG